MKAIANIAGAGGSGGTTSAILYYQGVSDWEGYLVTATSVLTSETYTETLDENGVASVEVPGMDRYDIEVSHDDSGTPVTDYSTSLSVNAGSFNYVEVGYDKTSWQGIQNILNDHKETELLSVGDELTAMIGGVNYTYQVGAINLYESHEVIFVPKTCVGARQHHTSNTNAGGWASSDIRTYLNRDFKTGLPDEIRNNLKIIQFKSSAGSAGSAITTTEDYIWLPREYEIFGATTYAATTEAQYCRQYPIFATAAQRIRTNNGVAASWWEASAYVSNSTGFCYVYTVGSADRNIASDSYGLVPCFRFTAD